ncbi:hypothetical protein N657DRAFT_99127 [Parathielavia appendiculata]|uniref:Uncharacterized protein n=1 Tax=Parathielavia appendiculata TaxID=2587402 RepID=A0AAN6TW46_9PEZI|nr:hypothetical protein N657DRAFT_99127 [Parathielavia appendiculata]
MRESERERERERKRATRDRKGGKEREKTVSLIIATQPIPSRPSSTSITTPNLQHAANSCTPRCIQPMPSCIIRPSTSSIQQQPNPFHKSVLGSRPREST